MQPATAAVGIVAVALAMSAAGSLSRLWTEARLVAAQVESPKPADELRLAILPVAHRSSHLQLAVLLAEDPGFFEHQGFDLAGKLTELIVRVRRREPFSGGLGDTITERLAQQLSGEEGPGVWGLGPAGQGLGSGGGGLASWRATALRDRLRQALVVVALERRYSKQQILESFLGRARFANGHSGAETAARAYFAKPASRLDAAEAATLAALLDEPSSHPANYPRILARRNNVLLMLRYAGALQASEFVAAVGTPLWAPTPRVRACDDMVLVDGCGLAAAL